MILADTNRAWVRAVLLLAATCISCAGCKDENSPIDEQFLKEKTILPQSNDLYGYGAIWHPSKEEIWFIGVDSLQETPQAGLHRLDVATGKIQFENNIRWNEAAWNPNERSILFLSEGVYSNVYDYDVFARTVTKKTGSGTSFDVNDDFPESSLSWFPSGDSIVYRIAGYQEDGWPGGVYIRDWTKPEPIYLANLFRVAVLDENRFVGSTSLSPNGLGQILIFDRRDQSHNYLTNFQIINDGKLFSNTITDVKISPNKEWVAFERNYDLWMVGIKENVVLRLTNLFPSHIGSQISWNNESSIIVFSVFHYPSSHENIYLYEISSNQIKPLREKKL